MSARHGLLLSLLLVLASCDSPLFQTDHGGVDDGNEALAAGEAGAALVSYEEAAESIPENPGLNYDRGLALSALDRHDESTQMLLRALDARDDELRGRVLAGLGLAYSRWGQHVERTGEGPPSAPSVDPSSLVDGPPPTEGPSAAEAALPKWERAVEHLEDALALRPTDKDVLRNLEVALLRVDPPCVARDDEAEENDAPGAPFTIELAAEAPPEAASNPEVPGSEEAAQDKLSWKRALLACPQDADWYAVRLEPGDRLSASLDASDGPAPLGLSLYAPGGTDQLRPPPDASELVTSLDLTAASMGGGDYLLQVSNPQSDEVPYGLEVQVRPACHRVEDHLEDNDTRADAQDVTPGSIDGLKLCPGDPDWYAVTLAEGESLFIFASPQGDEEEDDDPEEGDAPEPPSLELAIYDGEGRPIADGAQAEAARVATLLDPGEGRYLIRVGGPITLETRYQLLVQVVPPCPDGDDGHEDNDIVEDGTDLMALMAPEGGAGPGGQPGGPPGGQGGPPAPVLMRICPGDVDWLTLKSDPEAPTVVSLIFEHAKGDLAVRLTDETGVEVLQDIDLSSPEQNGESVGLPPEEEPKAYALEVRGKEDGENFYLLRLEQPKGDGDGDSQPNDEEQDPPDEDDPPPPDEPEEPEDQSPMEDRLDKLDHNPKNLEALKKALQSRRGPPEKDW
jgi:hypothetical protein